MPNEKLAENYPKLAWFGTYYHGTSPEAADAIQREGLQPQYGGAPHGATAALPGMSEGLLQRSVRGKVTLTPSRTIARAYGAVTDPATFRRFKSQYRRHLLNPSLVPSPSVLGLGRDLLSALVHNDPLQIAGRGLMNLKTDPFMPGVAVQSSTPIEPSRITVSQPGLLARAARSVFRKTSAELERAKTRWLSSQPSRSVDEYLQGIGKEAGVINAKPRPASVFSAPIVAHELGHACNHERPLLPSWLSTALDVGAGVGGVGGALYAAYKQRPLLAAGLMLASQVPVLIEEARASCRGLDALREQGRLTKKERDAARSTLLGAGGTYGLAALGSMGLVAGLALRDPRIIAGSALGNIAGGATLWHVIDKNVAQGRMFTAREVEELRDQMQVGAKVREGRRDANMYYPRQENRVMRWLARQGIEPALRKPYTKADVKDILDHGGVITEGHDPREKRADEDRSKRFREWGGPRGAPLQGGRGLWLPRGAGAGGVAMGVFDKRAFNEADASRVLQLAKARQLPKASRRILGTPSPTGLNQTPARAEALKTNLLAQMSSDFPLTHAKTLAQLTPDVRAQVERATATSHRLAGYILPGQQPNTDALYRAFAPSGTPRVPPSQRKMLDAITKGHELDETTARPQLGFIGAHHSPDVILREHNRLMTLPPGYEETAWLMRAARSLRETPAIQHATNGKFEYGVSPRLSRHARRRIGDLVEQAQRRELRAMLQYSETALSGGQNKTADEDKDPAMPSVFAKTAVTADQLGAAARRLNPQPLSPAISKISPAIFTPSRSQVRTPGAAALAQEQAPLQARLRQHVPEAVAELEQLERAQPGRVFAHPEAHAALHPGASPQLGADLQSAIVVHEGLEGSGRLSPGTPHGGVQAQLRDVNMTNRISGGPREDALRRSYLEIREPERAYLRRTLLAQGADPRVVDAGLAPGGRFSRPFQRWAERRMPAMPLDTLVDIGTAQSDVVKRRRPLSPMELEHQQLIRDYEAREAQEPSTSLDKTGSYGTFYKRSDVAPAVLEMVRTDQRVLSPEQAAARQSFLEDVMRPTRKGFSYPPAVNPALGPEPGLLAGRRGKILSMPPSPYGEGTRAEWDAMNQRGATNPEVTATPLPGRKMPFESSSILDSVRATPPQRRRSVFAH